MDLLQRSRLDSASAMDVENGVWSGLRCAHRLILPEPHPDDGVYQMRSFSSLPWPFDDIYVFCLVLLRVFRLGPVVLAGLSCLEWPGE